MLGRGGEEPETGGVVRDAGDAGDEHQDDDGSGEEGARRRDGVLADQSPA